MRFFNWLIGPVRNQYFDFKGRTPRKDYWMYVLVYAIVASVIIVTEELIGINVLGYVFMIALLIPSLAIAARRLHDTGLSVWWLLIGLIPLLGLLIMVILLARKSAVMENEYGPNPNVTSINKLINDAQA